MTPGSGEKFEGWSEVYKTLYTFIDCLFFAHPRSVGEGYWRHFGYALYIAWYLTFFCLIPVIIHSLCPYFFQTTTSEHIFSIANVLRERRGLSTYDNRG